MAQRMLGKTAIGVGIGIGIGIEGGIDCDCDPDSDPDRTDPPSGTDGLQSRDGVYADASRWSCPHMASGSSHSYKKAASWIKAPLSRLARNRST